MKWGVQLLPNVYSAYIFLNWGIFLSGKHYNPKYNMSQHFFDMFEKFFNILKVFNLFLVRLKSAQSQYCALKSVCNCVCFAHYYCSILTGHQIQCKILAHI